MPHRYKPLNEQTLVITGATSGIGLATARMAAKEGARLVLVARNEDVLKSVCAEVEQQGGKAIHVVADMGDEAQVQEIVRAAEREYGGFDTWVNDAGVVVFSSLDKLPTEDHQRLFQTNYWGIVYGSLAAVAHMRERPNGGTLINVASINAYLPVPMLGAYSASKAAVKAYSEVLRMELKEEGAPVAVSVVMPSGIATPISDHGRSHMEDRGQVMGPLYDPHVVANAILTAAQQSVRNVTVGAVGRMGFIARNLAPGLADRAMGWLLPRVQSSGKPKLPDNLYSAGNDGDVYLDQERQGLRISPFTYASLNPGKAAAATVVALAIGGVALASKLRHDRRLT